MSAEYRLAAVGVIDDTCRSAAPKHGSPMMHARKLFLWAALTAAAWSSVASAASVDLVLVIAADTSSSIDDREAALERQGVAAAFRSPEVLRAISSGALGRIAVL